MTPTEWRDTRDGEDSDDNSMDGTSDAGVETDNTPFLLDPKYL